MAALNSKERHNKLAITVLVLQKYVRLWQRTANECTKIENARAELLYCSTLKLFFADVPVGVIVVVFHFMCLHIHSYKLRVQFYANRRLRWSFQYASAVQNIFQGKNT